MHSSWSRGEAGDLPALGESWLVEDEQEDDEEGVACADRQHETVASLKMKALKVNRNGNRICR